MKYLFLLIAILLPSVVVSQDHPVVVRVSEAVICFEGQCHPVLVGSDTRPGTYDLSVLHVAQPGYGPHVLQYDRTDRGWYAIHQTYQHGNVQSRHGLYSGTTPQQRLVTAGCINVEPEIYDYLHLNYRRGQLVILP